MLNDLGYKLVSNFTCPEFHRCSFVSTIQECHKKIAADTSSVVKTCVENITTQLVGYKDHMEPCGYRSRKLCATKIDTGEILAGPTKVVLVVQSQLEKAMENTSTSLHEFYETNKVAILATTVIASVITIGLLTYKYLKQKQTTQENYLKQKQTTQEKDDTHTEDMDWALDRGS